MNRRKTLTLALAVALTLPAALGPSAVRADEKPAATKQAVGPAQKVVDAFRKGAWDEVVTLGAAVKTSNADYAKVQYVVGEAHLQKQSWADAETAFRAVLKKRPKAVPARTGLGKALAAQDKHADAEKELTEAVKQDAKDAGAHLALGEFLLGRGKAADAETSLRTAVKLDKKSPLAARALVDALLRQDEVKSAGKAARSFAKAMPKHPMAHFLTGWVADRADDDDDAIKAYEKAVALDDGFLDAHKNLAILCIAKNPLYRDKERTKKAFVHFEKYFELGGDDPELKRAYETIKSVLPPSMR